MRYIVIILWGIIFGIVNTVPAVSAATVAVICGFYDKLIGAISGVFKDFRRNAVFLLLFIFGMAGGLILFAKLISWLYELVPQILGMLFVGLILGSLPHLFHKTREEKVKSNSIVLGILAAAAMVSLMFVGSSDGFVLSSDGIGNLLRLVGLAFVGGIGALVPGISGMLLILVIAGEKGYLSLMTAVSSLDIGILAPFAIGIIASVLMLAALIKKCLSKWPQQFNFIIAGFVVGSIPVVIPPLDFSAQTLIAVLVAVVTAVLVWRLTSYREKLSEKKKRSDDAIDMIEKSERI